ncbi:DUF1570 domain-containing protein [Planctomycetales bacterium 10988]|nr:DUF1570 domain-containing protein [Planctomycetales bacterium 10988]
MFGTHDLTKHSLLFVVCCILSLSPCAYGLDRIAVRIEDRPGEVVGKILVEAEDGGILALSRDGQIWPLQPGQIAEVRQDESPFQPFTVEETSRRLLNEMPENFRIHTTRHYVICYNTTPAYAQWCGALFERLQMAFLNFWSQKGLTLSEPEFPLVAIIFSDRDSYQEFAKQELGSAVEHIIGYYSFRSNHMIMYDLTAVPGQYPVSRNPTKASEIARVLSRPLAERTVATIIHEATHQIAYNCGLQTRYADNPLWVSEGIALYFETPDLNSSRGWRTIGAVNRVRLNQFKKYLSYRPEDSIETLLRDDNRMKNPQQMKDAYSEAWAFTYFLLRNHPEEFIEYLSMLSEKPRLIWDDPQERIHEFQHYVGDLEIREREFLRYMKRLR